MKRWVIVIIAVVVLAAGAVFIVSRNKSSDNKDAAMTHTTQSTGNSNTQSTATNEVTIDNFAFSPAKVTVKKGTKVTWTNKDDTTHTVTSDSGSTIQSDSLDSGESYSTTFDTVGTFPYHCSFHTSMVGTVTVTE